MVTYDIWHCKKKYKLFMIKHFYMLLLEGSTFCDGGKHASFLPPVIQPDVLCHPDPRLDLLGYRCVPQSKFSNSLNCTKQIII